MTAAPVEQAESAPEGALDDPNLIAAMFALRRLMNSGEQFRHAVAEHFDVGLSETVAMSHLSIAGSLSPREVADKVGLTPSTVTALLDRLEHAGLAARAPHPSDRRKSVVTITDHGRDMLARVQLWMRAALATLDPAHAGTTAAILVDLAAALDVQAERVRNNAPLDWHRP